MVYYKVILDNRRPKADEIYPVIVRVTHNRKNTSITTGVRISNEFWDFKIGLVGIKHPNHQLLNKSITETFLKVQKIVLQLENEECFSFELLKERFTNSGKPLVSPKINYFNDYATFSIKVLK